MFCKKCYFPYTQIRDALEQAFELFPKYKISESTQLGCKSRS